MRLDTALGALVSATSPRELCARLAEERGSRIGAARLFERATARVAFEAPEFGGAPPLDDVAGPDALPVRLEDQPRTFTRSRINSAPRDLARIEFS